MSDTVQLQLALEDDDPAELVVPDGDAPGVEVWRDLDGRVCAYGESAGGRHCVHLPGLASFRFDDDSDTVRATPHPPARLDLIRDAFTRSVLPLVLQARGEEVLHASAFLAGGGVVAMCATSETGKSTLAFALRRRGYEQWADDAVHFDASAPRPVSRALPFSSRLHPDAAEHLGAGMAAGRFASAVEADRRPAAAAAPIAAVLVLERDESCDVAVAERLTPVPAFVALLTHAYCFSTADVERKRRMMHEYLDLASKVPVFSVRFRSGFDLLPAVLDRILEVACPAPRLATR